jgi:hypothetical protein
MFVALCGLLLIVPVGAQDMMTPSVEVADQVVLDGMVNIASAYSEGPGFVVIHIDNEGAPGPVIGQRWLNPGINYNIDIAIDAAMATPTLYAMLHADDNEIGVYEFGTVEGADAPVAVDGSVITPAFAVDIINAQDQFVSENTVTIASVTAQADGWLVIHSDEDGGPGPVLGQTLVPAGTSTNVVVELSDTTADLWPMLHVDTGEVGTYEFGTVEGADGPVVVDGTVATVRFATYPSVRVMPQIVTNGAGVPEMGAMMATPSVVAASVLSEGPGWLVIHADNEGGPGPVLGATAVPDGMSSNVVVELDAAAGITPVLWPMLHVDTGEVGTYEFGTVEGADGPVVVNEQVVTFPINAAPSLVVDGGALVMEEGMEPVVTIPAALIDAPGWIALHVDNGSGGPGPVVATYPLARGLHTDIEIVVNPDDLTGTVFPMLHYDTGEAGVYEFGTVEGADGPVVVGENVVVLPLTLGE